MGEGGKYTPTTASSNLVRILKAAGVGIHQIADEVGVCHATLYKHHRKDLQEGAHAANHQLVLRSYRKAHEGDGPMLRWWLERRMPEQFGQQTKIDATLPVADDGKVHFTLNLGPTAGEREGEEDE